jgi:hypothetical protein
MENKETKRTITGAIKFMLACVLISSPIGLAFLWGADMINLREGMADKIMMMKAGK